MANRSRIIRIFVSSTFKDMEPERNYLQAHTFKDLTIYCQERGWQFQAVDLRWGIPDEAGVDQKTISLCLKEIQRCQKLSPRPNFLILLGDRYGWCPPPAEIPQNEFEALVPFFPSESKELIDFWYKLDENALSKSPDGQVGGIYELLPRRGERENWADYCVYEPVEQELRQVLLRAALDAGIGGSEQVKYHASATHQEILAGAFETSDARDHVQCFVRRLSTPISSSLQNDYNENDPAKRDALIRLKEELRVHLGLNYHEYVTDLSDEAQLKEGMEALGQNVREALRTIIDTEISKEVALSPMEAENVDHLNFAADRARIFVGREDTLSQIYSYLKGKERAPFWVIGQPGSGKSALFAKAIDAITKDHPGIIFIARFIGTTLLSSSTSSLLRNVYQALIEAPGVSLKKYKDVQKLGNEIPVEYPRLAPFMANLFRSVVIKKPIFLVLDAVDQLPIGDPGRDLQWLPDELAPNLKIIVSVATDATDIVDMTRRRFTGTIYYLPLMGGIDGEQVLDVLLADSNRTLQPPQRTECLEKFARSGSPLYLRMIFEITRHWSSFYHPGMNTLPSSLECAIQDFLTMVASNHVPGFMERVLGYITCSRQGLSEQELIDILSSDKEYFQEIYRKHLHHALPEPRLPWVAWARLYADLESFLTRRGSVGVTTISLFHRQFLDTIKENYLHDNLASARHAIIAGHFLKEADWLGLAERSTPNGRKAVELIYQLRHGGLIDVLGQTLTDLHHLEAKCSAGMVDDLIHDYDAVLGDGGTKIPKHVEIEDMSRFIRQQSHNLRSRPDLFLQQAVNQSESKTIENKADEILATRITFVIRWLNKPRGRDPCIMTLMGHSQDVQAVVFSPDGNTIASGSLDKTVRLWDICTGKELRELKGHSGWVSSVAFSPDGSTIASGSSDTLRLWDARTGQAMRQLAGHSNTVMSVAFSPDGSKLVSGSRDMTVRLWDARTGNELAILAGHSKGVRAVTFSPDGRSIASGSEDNTMRLWNPSTGEERGTLATFKFALTSIAFSPDGSKIAAGFNDETVKLWDTHSSKAILELEGHSDTVTSVAFSPDGSTLASGSTDKTVRLWDARTGGELGKFAGHSGGITSVTFSPDGSKIASGSIDDTVKLWNANIDTTISAMVRHSDEVTSVRFSPDGNMVASGSYDRTVRLWDAHTGKELGILVKHTATVISVAFSPDGNTLVLGSNDGTVRLWDAHTGKELGTLARHSSYVTSVAFSSDGSKIASGSIDDTIKIWNVRTGKGIHELTGHSDAVTSVAFSPDNSTLASGSTDKTVRLWDTRTGGELCKLAGHSGGVYSVAFSPDGSTLASGSLDKTVRLWNVRTGKTMRTLAVHSGWVSSVVFLPGEPIIASGSSDMTVRLWNTFSERLICTFFAGGEIKSIDMFARGLLAAGDRNGIVYILHVDGFSPGTPCRL